MAVSPAALKTGFVSIVCICLLAGCGGADARRQKAFARGMDYYASANYEKARVEFRNALQIAPNDPDVRFQTGRTLERLGKIREAIQFYRGALDVRPDFPEARTELARVFLFAGAADEALAVLKPGLDKHPNDPSLLALRAATRVPLNDAAGALEDAERAYQIDPKREPTVAVLAGLYASSARSDKAQALLEQGIKDHPETIELRLALAQLYATLKQNEKTEAILRDVVRLKPEERANWLRLAQFQSGNGKDDAAEKSLRDAIARLPKDSVLQYSLVDFLSAKRGRPVAEHELLKMIAAADRNDQTPRFALGRFYEAGGEVGKAEALYQQIVVEQGTKASGLAARDQLASIRFQRNDAAGAEKLVDEVLGASPRDAGALSLRGNLLLAKGDVKGAIADFRAVLRDQPNAVGLARVLARAHLQNGEPALAEEVLRTAIETTPGDADARTDLAQLLVQVGKAGDAKSIAERLVKERPVDVTAQQVLYRAAAASKDYATARTAAAAIAGMNSHSVLGHHLLGLIAEEQNQPDAALKEYEAALESQPDAIEPLQAITRLLIRQKRAPEALKRLDVAGVRAPRSAVPASLKAELLVAERRYPEAEAALKEAIARAPRWWSPYHALAITAVLRGDRPAALAILSDSVAKVDEPNRLRAELAELYQAAGKNDDAIAQYEAMLAAQPQDKAAANNLAMLLVTARKDQASVARAAELSKALAGSTNPAFLDTYGWVKLKQGDTTGALPVLEKAQTGAPDSVTVLYHLGMAQMAAGQRDRAAASLKKVLAGDQKFAGVDEARAALEKLSRNL